MKKGRIALTTLLALCIALVLSVMPMSVFATETTAALEGTKLTTSHVSQALSGDYYVEPGKTLSLSGATGKSGLVVAAGKTLTIHIPLWKRKKELWIKDPFKNPVENPRLPSTTAVEAQTIEISGFSPLFHKIFSYYECY